MKKKPLAPQAQILWFSVLHQFSIPGLAPQAQHPPAPATDVARGGAAAAPGGWAGPPLAAGAPHLSRAPRPRPPFPDVAPPHQQLRAKPPTFPGGVGAGGTGDLAVSPAAPSLPHAPRSGSPSPSLRSTHPAPGPPRPSRPPAGGTDGPPAPPPARCSAQPAENMERKGNLPSGDTGASPGNGLREPGAAPPSASPPRPRRRAGARAGMRERGSPEGRAPRTHGRAAGPVCGQGWDAARLPHSPGAGRGRGLDGADTEPVGRVLQGLQGLLVGLVVILHGGEAGGPRRQRGAGGGGTWGQAGTAALREGCGQRASAGPCGGGGRAREGRRPRLLPAPDRAAHGGRPQQGRGGADPARAGRPRGAAGAPYRRQEAAPGARPRPRAGAVGAISHPRPPGSRRRPLTALRGEWGRP